MPRPSGCTAPRSRLVPGRASTLINLAAVQLRLARPADALESADAALAAERDSVDALLHRATALAQLGRAEEALAALPAPARDRSAPCRGVERTRHPAARDHRLDEAAHAFREALRHGADGELNAFYLASVEAGAAPATAPAAYVAGLFDSYADEFDSHLVGALRYQAHRQLVDQFVATCGGGARFARRSTSAAGPGCAARWCGRWSLG